MENSVNNVIDISDSALRKDEQKDDIFEYRVASLIDDKLKAWKLAYEVYRKKGYADFRESGLWYGPHDNQSEATTFIVERNGAVNHNDELVAACTVVPDAHMQLPSDELYHNELNTLRTQGRKICEITSLVNTVGGRIGINIVAELFRHVFLTARCINGASDLIVSVNPRHCAYYERTLLFERIGSERRFNKVQGAPAILLRLDFETMAERYAIAYANVPEPRNMYKFFFSPDGFDKLSKIISGRKPSEKKSSCSSRLRLEVQR